MFARQLRRILAVASAAALVGAQAVDACTGVMLRNADNTTVHGRTVEFGMKIEITVVAIPRGMEFQGRAPDGDGLK